MAGHEALQSDACSAVEVDGDRVAATRQYLVGPEEAVSIASVFGLLSDPNRVRVLFALLEAGELCVCDLAEMVYMSASALSHALRLLRMAGVVTARRDGRMMRYRLADSHVRLLLDVTREHLEHGPVLATGGV